MVTKEQVMDVLKNCYDTEISMVSLLDLGLIYDVQVEDNNNVNIKMTLTSPGCPMHSMIAEDVKSKVTNVFLSASFST